MWINTTCYSVQENWFSKCFLSNEPLHKISLSAKVNLNLSLNYPGHYTLFIPPPWVWLDLLSMFVLTHSLFLQKKIQTLCLTMLSRGTVLHPALPMDLGYPQEYRMAQDSDDFLFVFYIVACVWIVILAIVALLCSLPRRVVR